MMTPLKQKPMKNKFERLNKQIKDITNFLKHLVFEFLRRGQVDLEFFKTIFITLDNLEQKIKKLED